MKNSIPNSVEIVDNHLDQFFDDEEDIVAFDEIESEVIHRDIFFIKANENRPYHILLSCGMSALPMKVPEDVNSSPYAEVMFLLPKEWNLNYDSFGDERNYWPIRLMKQLMILPHPDETWLGFGHTFSYQEDGTFAEGAGFNSVMLAYSREISDDFTQIELENNQSVSIYSLIPLYKEELEFKNQNGAVALLELLDQHDVTEIVKIGRKNVCT
ncbi:suppressor of fused domain protein [Pedobacter sp. WC2501]|uniref:suppressor of fused domain protein n=1 Tax=Pedobacter sp. WC2501 TaxID=3461400 RepID=UPI004045DCF1